MILQTLLVSKDDQAAETLLQALAQFGVAVERLSAADVAQARLTDEHYDQVIIDFDDHAVACQLLQMCREAGPDRDPSVTVALVRDSAQIREILGEGTHFILRKPITLEQALATLRASTALLKRERRQSFRVPVQAPISIHPDDSHMLEGILLDVSNGGMDVLAANPLATGALVHFCFELPDGVLKIEGDAEVAWGNSNGQTGLRFLDIDPIMRDQLSQWLTSHAHEALPDEADPVTKCKLTDLSLGGCYVKTESPFPQSSAVDLCLHAAGLEIHTEGLVRIMHPAHGMGIEFPARTEEQRKSVGEFIEFLTSQPGASPELEISPRALRASAEELNHQLPADSDDPLLELLRGGDRLNEEDFLGQLHQQRSSASVEQ
jgi:c-di-GMP-binding flagellar brake protein YcgR